MKALNFTKPCQTQFVQHTQYTSYELATSVCFLLTNRSETLRWGRALIVEREDGIEERSFKRAKIQQLKCDSQYLYKVCSLWQLHSLYPSNINRVFLLECLFLPLWCSVFVVTRWMYTLSSVQMEIVCTDLWSIYIDTYLPWCESLVGLYWMGSSDVYIEYGQALEHSSSASRSMELQNIHFAWIGYWTCLFCTNYLCECSMHFNILLVGEHWSRYSESQRATDAEKRQILVDALLLGFQLGWFSALWCVEWQDSPSRSASGEDKGSQAVCAAASFCQFANKLHVGDLYVLELGIIFPTAASSWGRQSREATGKVPWSGDLPVACFPPPRITVSNGHARCHDMHKYRLMCFLSGREAS